MKIYIDKIKDTEALWLVIDREEGGTAHPIQEDEVRGILEACEEWLQKPKGSTAKQITEGLGELKKEMERKV